MKSHDVSIKRLHSPKETQEILCVSHATLYRMINAGKLDARKLGGKTVITGTSIGALIESLPKFGTA